MENFESILEENRRRNRLRDEAEMADPEKGVGSSGDRVEVGPESWTGGKVVAVPREMVEDPKYASARNEASFRRLRCRYDFEYWAWACCRIKDKESGNLVPFVLNRPQRRVVKMLESDRRADRPMRMVILKARQWGGSTVVEMYIAWIQLLVATRRHAIVCGAEKTGTQVVVNLYADMLLNYPEELWEGEKMPQLKTSKGILELSGRDNRVYVAASTNPNAVRGVDASLVHLTEVAYWKSSPKRDPWDAVRAIYCSVAVAPMTLIVLESTADGVGSFFHDEWLRAESGRSDFRPVFVPWHEIRKYSLPFASEKEARRLWEEMIPYELDLWERLGLTLEQIHWYHRRRRELKEHAKMKSEFPTDADEAFTSAVRNVFSIEKTKLLREGCCEPLAYGEVASATGLLRGADSLTELRFVADARGYLHVWKLPEEDEEYAVAVDIGGLSEKSDWSVITVMSRADRPEVVAQWRGHIDHDLLVWKAAQIASYYNEAVLAFESNTLESETINRDEAPYQQGALVLHTLYEHYRNLFRRHIPGTNTYLPGFHTNRSTKTMIITELVAAVRDGRYIERSNDAVNEMDTYERMPNGAYAARQGYHDDLLMTRAICLEVIRREK